MGLYIYYKNLLFGKQKHGHILWACQDAHDQPQIAVGKRGLRYEQHDPSDAAQIVTLQFNHVNYYWKKELNNKISVCSACSGIHYIHYNFLAFSLHPSSAICFNDYFEIWVVCEMNLCMDAGYKNGMTDCA